MPRGPEKDRASSMMPGLRCKKTKEHYLFSLSDRPGPEVDHSAAKRNGRHITATGRQAQPQWGHTHFPPLAVFEYRLPGSRAP